MDSIRSIIPHAVSSLRKSADEPEVLLPTSTTGVCATCHGRGYTRADMPLGHPQFGKLVECACKVAQKKSKKKDALSVLSGITSLRRFKDATFSNYAYHGLIGLKDAYQAALKYAQEPEGWLVLTGAPGCGKTHLAVAIAKRQIEAGSTVLIQTVPDLLDHLRAAFNPAIAESYDTRFEEMKEAQLLILDDYGAQSNTPWATEKLFQLVNYRYNASAATVITSNDVHLTGIDPRVQSRICDKGLVKLIKMETARDYRVYGDGENEEEENSEREDF